MKVRRITLSNINFQVDETSDPEKQLYGVIIENYLLYNMGVDILFKERQIQWNDDKIPLKEMVLDNFVRCFIACIRTVLFFKKQKSDKIVFSLKIIFIKVSYINYCIGL